MRGWKEYKLGDVAEIVCGATPSTSKREYWSDEINWVTAKDISEGNGYKISETERTISILGLESCSTVLLPTFSTVLIARGATMGRSAMISSPMALNQTCYALVGKTSSIDSFFLFYSIKGLFHYFEGIAHGAIFNTVIGSSLRETSINLPPLPEQRAIAGILSSLDDKIDLLHRQNKTLEGIASALWRKMFIEDADPGWKKGKLEDVAEINPLRSIKKGTSTSYLDMSSMPTHGPFPREWVQRPFLSGMKFRNGDTIIARITPCLENGKTAFINFLNDNEIAWGSTEYIVLAPRTGYCPEWFYFLARSDDFRDFAIQNMTGTSGRQRVSGDSIAHYEIAIPPVTVVEGFRTFSEPIMNHIKQNSLQARTLSRIRDTLLPKLMSGEVRLKL